MIKLFYIHWQLNLRQTWVAFLSSTLKEVSMNGHSSNIGYNIFISFTKFFSKSLPRWFDSNSVHKMLFFMLNKTFLTFIVFFRLKSFYSHSYCL